MPWRDHRYPWRPGQSWLAMPPFAVAVDNPTEENRARLDPPALHGRQIVGMLGLIYLISISMGRSFPRLASHWLTSPRPAARRRAELVGRYDRAMTNSSSNKRASQKGLRARFRGARVHCLCG